MSSSRKPRSRTIQRKLERDQRKLGEDRIKLARMSDGGAPQRPLYVETAAIVESRATTFPCVACTRTTRVLNHEAISEGVNRVRRVTVGCPWCGTQRLLFFQITGSPLN